MAHTRYYQTNYLNTSNKGRSSCDQLCKRGHFYLSQQCFRGVNNSIKYCANLGWDLIADKWFHLEAQARVLLLSGGCRRLCSQNSIENSTESFKIPRSKKNAMCMI